MSALPTLAAAVPLAIWIYLLAARGGFWRARERDEWDDASGAVESDPRPEVVAIIPARDEAASIAQAVSSLLRQDYAGRLRIIVVDDNSDDDTAAKARAAAAALGASSRLDVLRGAPLQAGWTGKLWALRQGIAHACGGDEPEFLLLTDADIWHAPDNVRRLVAHACAGDRVLVSMMARLRADTLMEQAFIPAFVLFFQMLYPFAWVNRRDRSVAAAAGGCMLVRRDALEAAGGIESIRMEIIDDCALGARMKKQGAIWLGLTERAISVRSYTRFDEIRAMVTRTAYAQLRYSPLRLSGAIAALLLTFLAPALLALFAHGAARAAGALAWLAMALAYQPTLKFYRRPLWWGLLLPGIGTLYALLTFDSALQHWRGRGGMWKGRAQARR